jgi:hypothetical protein
MRPPLCEWQAALEDVEQSPYVGPRPQTKDDRETRLFGRSDDLDRITRAVLARNLVVLHGYSGSGKSSLLQNGLCGRLERAKFTVLVCRQWGGLPDRFEGTTDDIVNRVERYIAGGVLLTSKDPRAKFVVPPELDLGSIEDEGGLGRVLDREYGESAVLILDQFEELLRQHDKDAAKSIVRWIVDSCYRHNTHFVVSLRTDSLHLLDPLLRGVKPFSMDRVWLRELADPKDIEDVIRDRGSAVSPITAGAVDTLMELWRLHQPKMLDLQATLYALHFRTKQDSGRAVISRRDVRKLQVAAGTGGDPFKFGLRDAIRLKIDHAEEACSRLGLDDYLVCGAREVARRAAPFLSSGDFKVPIQEAELIRIALGRELHVLEGAVFDELGGPAGRPSRRLINETLDVLYRALRNADDFLALGVPELASSDNLSGPLAAVLAANRPQPAGRDDVTAGPMMSSTATATLFEEIRRAFFATEWLVSTGILRKDLDDTLQLVHDGSGGALRAWAEAGAEADPDHAFRQLTGARGEHYVWAGEIGGDKVKVLANLNWRNCRISATFRNILFVNCDFRGSQFDSCDRPRGGDLGRGHRLGRHREDARRLVRSTPSAPGWSASSTFPTTHSAECRCRASQSSSFAASANLTSGRCLRRSTRARSNPIATVRSCCCCSTLASGCPKPPA